MTCSECQSITVAPKWNRYDSNCIYCGARLLRQLGTLNIPKEMIQKRRTKVLTDWVKQGHSEDQIRNLLRSGPWIKPKEKNAK